MRLLRQGNLVLDRLTEMWRRWRQRRAMDALVDEMRQRLAALSEEMDNKNNAPSHKTVTRETRINRTGCCLECGTKLNRISTGRIPLYCGSCRGERYRQQNRTAKARQRAKKRARAA